MSKQDTFQASTPMKRLITFKFMVLAVLIPAIVTLAVAYWPRSDGPPPNSHSVESLLAELARDVNVIDEGLKPDDRNFDNTPRFNKLLDKIGPDRTIHFPSGVFYFNSPPKTITTGLVIRGDGVNSTTLIRNYNATSTTEALIHTRSTIAIKTLGIQAGAGTRNGGAIKLEGEFASSSRLENLYVTGEKGGTFYIPLTLWSQDEKGIRSCKIDQVELFAAEYCIAWFVNVKELSVAHLGAFPAGGIANQVTIQGYNAKLRADNVQLNMTHLVKLYLYWSDNIHITGPVLDVIPDKKDRPSTNVVKNGKIIIP